MQYRTNKHTSARAEFSATTKVGAVILIALATGAGVLSARQQRLRAAHELARAHEQTEQLEEARLRIRARIAGAVYEAKPRSGGEGQ